MLGNSKWGNTEKSNMRKRGILVDGLCSMCGLQEESDDHLFRDCSMSDHIWRSMAMRGNVSRGVDIIKWIMSNLLFLFKEDNIDDVRVVEFISTVWAILLHRNEVVFRNTSCSLARVKDLIKESKDRWLEVRNLQAMQLVTEQVFGTKIALKPFVWTIQSCT